MRTLLRGSKFLNLYAENENQIDVLSKVSQKILRVRTCFSGSSAGYDIVIPESHSPTAPIF